MASKKKSTNASVKVKFKNGKEKSISVDKKVLNVCACTIAFVVGAVTGGAAVTYLKS